MKAQYEQAYSLVRKLRLLSELSADSIQGEQWINHENHKAKLALERTGLHIQARDSFDNRNLEPYEDYGWVHSYFHLGTAWDIERGFKGRKISQQVRQQIRLVLGSVEQFNS